MNRPPATTPDVPADVVTRTSTWPAAPGGDTTVSCVDDTTTTDEPADEPNCTVAPAENPVPVTVTDVPPAVEPDDGDTDDTTGAAGGGGGGAT